MPSGEQIPGEDYRFNQRLRVYVVQVERTAHGPQITVSRTHHGLLRRLLEIEVPEVLNGVVEIKAIAREAGFRSKVAVAASQPGVDPVGSCVGMRGIRIQHIVNELNGEKIDVVAWSPSVETFIGNALSPAKVLSVYLNDYDKRARVVVPDRSLSLAIGREGQNARLAAKLTGWRIDIKGETEAAEEAEQLAAEDREAELRAKEIEAAQKAAAELLAKAWVSLEEDEYSHLGEPEPVSVVASTELAEEPAQTAEQEGAEVQLVGAQAVAEQDLVLAESEQETEIIAEGPVAEAEVLSGSGQEEAAEEPEVAQPVVSASDDSTAEWAEGELEEENEQVTGSQREESRRRKNRRRTLEYDERLGRVVSRRKRKPSRQTHWEEEDDWG